MSQSGKGLHQQAQNESTNMYSGAIIADFSYRSKLIFLVIGFEHEEIMERLEVNHLLFATPKSFDNFSMDERILSGYIPYFVGLKDEYTKSPEDMGFIDLEVLKAVELIPPDELSQNDFEIGLVLPKSYTLSDYIDEVKQEARNEPKELYEYMSTLLNRACFIANTKKVKGYL